MIKRLGEIDPVTGFTIEQKTVSAPGSAPTGGGLPVFSIAEKKQVDTVPITVPGYVPVNKKTLRNVIVVGAISGGVLIWFLTRKK